MNNTPIFTDEYECDNGIFKSVYEVLEEVKDPFPGLIPVRPFWLIINTDGELDIIYYAIGRYHQSHFVKARW